MARIFRPLRRSTVSSMPTSTGHPGGRSATSNPSSIRAPAKPDQCARLEARDDTSRSASRPWKGEKRFEKYHRVLGPGALVGLGWRTDTARVAGGAPSAGWPVLVGIDETVERRKGRKIGAKGVYRDAVRSRRVARGQMLGTEVGEHDAAGALALEFPAVGLAVLDRASPPQGRRMRRRASPIAPRWIGRGAWLGSSVVGWIAPGY